MTTVHPHTSFIMTAVIARMGWSVVPHPLYSPDLAPSDFYLFPSMKVSLHGKRFDHLDEVKKVVTLWMRECDGEFFQNGFLSWIKQWRKCIDRRRDYIEG